MKEIISKLNEINKVNFSADFRLDTFSSEEFKSTLPKFNNLLERFNSAFKVYNEFPQNLKKEFYISLELILDLLKDVRKYNDDVFFRAKDKILSRFNDIFENSSLWWAFAKTKKEIFELQERINHLYSENNELKKNSFENREDLEVYLKSLEQDYLHKLEELKELVASSEQIKYKLENEYNTFENRYKDATQKQEALFQINLFEKNNLKNKQESHYWLATIIGLILITIGLAYWSLACLCYDFDCFRNYENDSLNDKLVTFAMIKQIGIRTFIFSILTFLIVFGVKNYNALMHNITVNTHRQTSLEAALAMMDKITNEATREKIITEASSAIFKHQKTGYLRKDDTKVVNIPKQ